MNLLLQHCAAAFSGGYSGTYGLFFMFFLAGFTGSFTHCIVMCSPMIATDALNCGGKCASKCSKTVQSSGLFYHLGRMTTYGGLGFFAALLSKQIATFSFWHFISAFMLTIAGLMFIISSLPNCKHFLLKPSGKNSYIRGALLGFMPCGLIYAALMMAAATANPYYGFFAMVAFVFGTIPILVLANMGIKLLTDKWQKKMQLLGRVVMAVNGVSLLVMAGRLVSVSSASWTDF